MTGTEFNRELASSDLRQTGTPYKYAFREELEKNEFYHINWFPQKYCQRVMHWVGNTTEVIAYVISQLILKHSKRYMLHPLL